MGNKNHSTVILACRRINKVLQEDDYARWITPAGQKERKLREIVTELEEQLALPTTHFPPVVEKKPAIPNVTGPVDTAAAVSNPVDTAPIPPASPVPSRPTRIAPPPMYNESMSVALERLRSEYRQKAGMDNTEPQSPKGNGQEFLP